MQSRKDILTTGEVYHVLTRSIAGFRVFNSDFAFSRMMETIHYYQKDRPAIKFSRFLKLCRRRANPVHDHSTPQESTLVDVVAFCLMPTHLHIILKQVKENGISIFMGTILNSYTRYFNTKSNRKGPLWEGRFKSVLIKSTEQLIHLTRYIHLNPVSAFLVEKPEEWEASSYREYVSHVAEERKFCKFDGLLQIDPLVYKDFVLNQKQYQRELAQIKHVLLE